MTASAADALLNLLGYITGLSLYAMLLMMLLVPGTPLPYVIYTAVGAAFIWLAHADNIERLLHGTERKFDIGLLAGKTPPSEVEGP